MFWVNEDRPTHKDVLHREGCKSEQAKRETPNKGINVRKRDSGGVGFRTEDEALKEYPDAQPCGECMQNGG